MVYPVERSEASATLGLLAEELDFYTMYAWCLDSAPDGTAGA